VKIWQRYLFRQISSTFFFLIVCLFILYLFIDLSMHGVRLTKTSSDLFALMLYYVQSFSTQLDLFVPLAFLLATLKVLFDLSSHLEILSLQMATLSKKRILLPIFTLALLLTGFGLANHEWIAPKALATSLAFKEAGSTKKKKLGSRQVHSLALPNNEELVFHAINYEKQTLSDVFWIKSPDDFWHMKTLSFETPPTAAFADHFGLKNGRITKQESFDQRPFDELTRKTRLTPASFASPEYRSISSLLAESTNPSRNQTMIQTHLHHKLATPMLSLLILLTAAPFALIHSRNRPTFLIVSLSLLAFILVIALNNGLLILSENNIIAPWQAMWLVPGLLFLMSARRFARL
jgi:lipopolysaccharide export LptBFGC system permease protein LptF